VITWSPSFERHLHADDDGFLPDIEVAEPADEAHAVKLAGLLLEAADQQHLAIGFEFGFLVEFGDPAVQPALFSRLLAGCGGGALACSHLILPMVL
jgi:hypothetical protein